MDSMSLPLLYELNDAAKSQEEAKAMKEEYSAKLKEVDKEAETILAVIEVVVAFIN